MPYEKGNGPSVVVALGGNALGNNPAEQLELVKNTAKHIVDMVDEGVNVVVTHGNGPQVGMINNAFDVASRDGDAKVPSMPFPECGAMSQGYIGYHLTQAIQGELKRRNIARAAVNVITQTVVDPDDEAFSHPTKPVGAFMTEQEAKAFAEKTGCTVKEDAGRGWRRVVASPIPQRIVEFDAVKGAFMTEQEAKAFAEKTGCTVKEDAGRGWRRVVASPIPQRIVEFDAVKDLIDNGYIVVSTGGGGVPVFEVEDSYEGVAAVIDKDRSASMLASGFEADMLVILTAVEKVCVNYGKPDQKTIDHMSVAEVQEYISQGQFAPGSMLPKVEACLAYVEAFPQGKAIITSLECAAAGLRGETGTVITMN